jgi:predicted DNA-binding transcriptional regulator AlpA
MTRRPHPHAKLLTLKQIEAEYGLPYATVWTLVREGRLPRLDLPGQRSIYVRRADLDAFIDAHLTEVVR